MKKIQFKKDIEASAQKVYETTLGLIDIKTYEGWTAEFNPTSTYEGTWEKGTKMCFVGTDKNGKRGGMVSEIVEHIPAQFVSIRHYGMIDGDKEITEGPDVEQWAGSLENYSFHEQNGITTVTIEMDTAEGFDDYFNNTWPKALNKLKELAEN